MIGGMPASLSLPSDRLPRWRATCTLLGCWSITMIAAGHGMAPLGLALAWPFDDQPALLPAAWLAVLLVLAARAWGRRWAYVVATAALLVPTALAFTLTEVWWFTGLTAIPFGAVLALQWDAMFNVYDDE